VGWNGRERGLLVFNPTLTMMVTPMRYLLFVGLLLFSSPVRAEDSTYALTLAGKSCKVWGNEQTLSCEYRVGTGLRFSINGIGNPDTGVAFLKSSIEADFYAGYGMLHGCIIIKRGRKGLSNPALLGPGTITDFAFVSPKNGKVYRDWVKCQTGM